MILEDEGKLCVEDPVEKYLPEFKGQMLNSGKDKEHPTLVKPEHAVTVTHLLTHTSGLPSFRPYDSQTHDPDSLSKLLFATQLERAPGERLEPTREPTIVYRDNLFFDEYYLHAFMTEALKRKRAVRAAFSAEDPSFRGRQALFVGGWAVSQLWMFWVAPLIGAAIAGVVYGTVFEEEAPKLAKTATAR